MGTSSRGEVLSWTLQFVAFLGFVWVIVYVLGQDPEQPLGVGSVDCGQHGVDVVFTWVNGSDPINVAKRKQMMTKLGKREQGTESLENEGRFRDYDTLRYAMRSVLQNFPALRYIFLVIADGEALPVWLDLDKGDRVRIVRHSQIMDADLLPTFNSNAIETNLHLIPGLSPCFAYLNDDMMYGRTVPLSVFWNSRHHLQVLHFGHWKAPLTEFMEENSWHQAIALNNDHLNEHYGSGKKNRLYPMHGCYFFHRETFAKMRSIMKDTWDLTLRTPLRSNTDNVVSFLYPHVALEEFGAINGNLQLYYTVLSPDPKKNIESLRAIVKRKPQCICINDGLEGNKEFEQRESRRALMELQMALELLFPSAAPWERKELIPDFTGRISFKYFEGPQLADFIIRLAIGIPLGVVCCIMCMCCVGECMYRRKNPQRGG